MKHLECLGCVRFDQQGSGASWSSGGANGQDEMHLQPTVTARHSPREPRDAHPDRIVHNLIGSDACAYTRQFQLSLSSCAQPISKVVDVPVVMHPTWYHKLGRLKVCRCKSSTKHYRIRSVKRMRTSNGAVRFADALFLGDRKTRVFAANQLDANECVIVHKNCLRIVTRGVDGQWRRKYPDEILRSAEERRPERSPGSHLENADTGSCLTPRIRS